MEIFNRPEEPRRGSGRTMSVECILSLMFFLFCVSFSFGQKVKESCTIELRELSDLIFFEKGKISYQESIVIGTVFIGSNRKIDSLEIVYSTLSGKANKQLITSISESQIVVPRKFKRANIRFFISTAFAEKEDFSHQILKAYQEWRLWPERLYKNEGNTRKGRKTKYLKEIFTVIHS